MNFYDYALRDVPSNLYKKNGTNFTDIAIPSGSSTAAISTFGPSLIAGGQGSISIGLGGTRKYSFTESNFIAGREQRDFTLSCVVQPLVVTQEFSVFSHSNGAWTVDGISLDADNVIFRVKFAAGDVTAKWEMPDVTEAYLVHGVYTQNSIKLYVNGDLKTTTEIPSNYPASGFTGIATAGTMYAGSVSATNDKVLLDAPASYPFALSSDSIKAQFNAVRDVPSMQLIVASMGGVARDGSQRRISQQQVFNSASSWQGVSSDDVSVNSGELVPAIDPATGNSKPGVWIGQYAIENPNVTSMAGIKAEWNGNGSFTVQSSLDGGSTYQAVTNGELIPTSQGLNPAGKVLLIKITFAGGIANDVSEVRDLTLTTYADNYIYTMGDDSRKLTIIGTVSTSLEQNQPIERNSRPGIHVYGGSLLMPDDTSASPVSVQTLEFWVTPKGVTSGTGGYIFDTRAYGGTAYMYLIESNSTWNWTGASAVYINGVAQTTGVVTVKNEPQHIVFVFPTAFNTKIALAAAGQLAEYNLIANYPTALTAAQVAQLYANYQGVAVSAATETGVVTMFEPTTPYVFTLADWAHVTQQ